MIICDDQQLIRYYYSGWPGSVHDNRIFKNTTIFTNPDNFFDKRQYILGDSAFENHSFMVSSYRSPQGQPITWEKEVFNHAMSKPRVISEHTIGILKGRFQWLRLVRMVVKQDLESFTYLLAH
jgi:DDE superfamily endonuclease